MAQQYASYQQPSAGQAYAPAPAPGNQPPQPPQQQQQQGYAASYSSAAPGGAPTYGYVGYNQSANTATAPTTQTGYGAPPQQPSVPTSYQQPAGNYAGYGAQAAGQTAHPPQDQSYGGYGQTGGQSNTGYGQQQGGGAPPQQNTYGQGGGSYNQGGGGGRGYSHGGGSSGGYDNNSGGGRGGGYGGRGGGGDRGGFRGRGGDGAAGTQIMGGNNTVKDGMFIQEDTVFVAGMPKSVGPTEIAEYFGKIGIVKKDKRTQEPKIWMYKDQFGESKGECTVTYEDSDASQAAVNWFNGKDFNGQPIKVSIAQRKVKEGSYAAGGRGGGRDGRGRGGFDRGGRGGGRGFGGRGGGDDRDGVVKVIGTVLNARIITLHVEVNAIAVVNHEVMVVGVVIEGIGEMMTEEEAMVVMIGIEVDLTTVINHIKRV